MSHSRGGGLSMSNINGTAHCGLPGAMAPLAVSCWQFGCVICRGMPARRAGKKRFGLSGPVVRREWRRGQSGG